LSHNSWWSHAPENRCKISEIQKQALDADTLLLEVSGEGLVGLTRGFIHAGAKRVVASLWKVNDAATAELMRRFYQGMLGAKRLTPAAALRAAQVSMLREQRWRSPFYWAAFSLQGE
jgi:CHAT domain-containing protein